MAAPIVPVSVSISPMSPAPVVAAGSSFGEPFTAFFTRAVAQVEQFGANAQAAVGQFLSGEGEELHQVAVKSEQAELSFELFMQMRNKMVSAYQEVMRMQI